MPFVPPSTTIQLKPLMFKQPLLLSQYGRLIIAFASKYMVSGALEVPLPWAVNSVAIVPQRFTVVPGPIWLAPEPQFAALLNHAGVCGLVVQAPWACPLGVMYTLVAEEKPRAENANTKTIDSNVFRGLFKTFLHQIAMLGLRKLAQPRWSTVVASRGVAHDLLDLLLSLYPVRPHWSRSH
jgi:hypothetical protein